MRKALFFLQPVFILTLSAGLAMPTFAQGEKTNASQNPPVADGTTTQNPPVKPRKHYFGSPKTRKGTTKNVPKTTENPRDEKFVEISKATPGKIEKKEEQGAEKIDTSKVIVASAPEGAGLISNIETGETKKNQETNTVGKEPKTEIAKPETFENTGANEILRASKPKEFKASASFLALRAKVAEMKPTDIYKVGTGDVLDIRLLNTESTESTLYTILEGGILDFPLAGETLKVDGLTVEEIDLLLTERVKLYENPEITVSVRDFASQKITVLGLVEKTGAKPLRRQAVPLYVALAEAVLQPEAKSAVIIRADKKSEIVHLDDIKAKETLLQAGDIVRVAGMIEKSASTNQFFYIIGAVNSAGQKEFHQGLTLTQAVFAAGGLTKNASNRAIVMRQNSEGLLVTLEYSLKQIRDGKVPDPVLQAGDRIEVGN